MAIDKILNYEIPIDISVDIKILEIELIKNETSKKVAKSICLLC